MQLWQLLVAIPGYSDHVVLPALCGRNATFCSVMYLFNWARVMHPEAARGARSLAVLVETETGKVFRVQYRGMYGEFLSFETVDDLELHLGVDRDDCPINVRFKKSYSSLEGPYSPDRPWTHCIHFSQL